MLLELPDCLIGIGGLLFTGLVAKTSKPEKINIEKVEVQQALRHLPGRDAFDIEGSFILDNDPFCKVLENRQDEQSFSQDDSKLQN